MDIKEIYETLPKGMKSFFSPIFIQLMVKNPIFMSTYRELNEFEKLSYSQRKSIQFDKLKGTLCYAKQNVPYYQKLFSKYDFDVQNMKHFEELNKLPLLEKTEAIEAGEQLYSTERNLKSYISYTGGSSGKALTVKLDRSSVYSERAFVCHFLAKHGYDLSKTKTVAFWGHNKDTDYYYSPLKNEIVISPFRLFQENQFEGICKDIENFGAEFVMGYPSAVYAFAQKLKQSGKTIDFKHVIYYAENCSDEEKEYIEQVLKCPVDSYYGHTERAVFAQLEEGNCVFNDLYGYTELIPTDEPDEFRIACTGFLNHSMPLIRYATDDVVKIAEDGSLRLIGHKRSEIHLIGKEGQKIFKGALTLHLKEMGKVRQYQYVQNVQGYATLQLLLDQKLNDKELNEIRTYIVRRCEGILEVDIAVVEQLIMTPRGKYLWAINNIK